jgi:transposase
MSKSNRSYSQEFIKESVYYALNAISITQAAKDLGIPEATLNGWVRKAKLNGDAVTPSGEPIDVSKMVDELRELRKQVSRLEQEKAILKKAATYFAKELG